MTPKPTPILFLDLDGTIIKGLDELGHFIKGPDEVELYDGVLDKLKTYKAKGWRLVLISNQGGIALNYIQDSTVSKIMMEVGRLTANLFDRMYWCVHHPEAEVVDGVEATLEASSCFCRKPRAGLVYAAMHSLSDQYSNEYYRPWTCEFVGDMESDRICAESCGIQFKLAKTWRSEV